jgi:Ser/Thr protein kinase RdoA (MazF antagonist)
MAIAAMVMRKDEHLKIENDVTMGGAPDMSKTLTFDRTLIATEKAAGLCADPWGISGELRRLPSERDDLVLVSTPDGKWFAPKLSNPHEDPMVIDLQVSAMVHALSRDPSLLIPTLSGNLLVFEDSLKAL